MPVNNPIILAIRRVVAALPISPDLHAHYVLTLRYLDCTNLGSIIAASDHSKEGKAYLLAIVSSVKDAIRSMLRVCPEPELEPIWAETPKNEDNPVVVHNSSTCAINLLEGEVYQPDLAITARLMREEKDAIAELEGCTSDAKRAKLLAHQYAYAATKYRHRCRVATTNPGPFSPEVLAAKVASFQEAAAKIRVPEVPLAPPASTQQELMAQLIAARRQQEVRDLQKQIDAVRRENEIASLQKQIDAVRRKNEIARLQKKILLEKEIQALRKQVAL